MNMFNSPPPPTYEEAVLGSVDPNNQQHGLHRQTHSLNNGHHYLTSKTTNLSSSHLVHSTPSLMTSNSGISSKQDEKSSIFCARNLSAPSVQTSTCRDDDGQISNETPAIIIHSAVSTPIDDEINQSERLCLKENKTPANEIKECDDTSEQNRPMKFVFNGAPGQTSQINFENERSNIRSKEEHESDLTYENITSDHSSILHGSEIPNPQHEDYRQSIESRKVNGVENSSEIYGQNEDTIYDSNKNGHRMISNKQTHFRSHDSLVKKHRFQNQGKNSEKSKSMVGTLNSSLDQERPRKDSFSTTQNVRERSGTLDEATLSSKHAHKQGLGKGSPVLLTCTLNKMSKSYNDLSIRRHSHCRKESHYDRSVNKCYNCHSSSTRDYRNSISSNNHTPHNSSNHVHRTGVNYRSHRHYLIPDAGNLQGARSMRSVSVDDVRMRNGPDEYVWKDGKVQLKNGEISHGESVRYVWKDGHVEKITTDANNEETQVEIVETSENKACNKINPVFVCIFLVVVIAVVIIIPVYFTR